MSQPQKHDAILTLKLDNFDGTSLTVERMNLGEALSEPYSCKVQFVTDATISPVKVVGHSASLTINAHASNTRIRGVAVSFRQHDRTMNDRFVYTVVIAPKFELLRLNHRNVVYGADKAVKIGDLIKTRCDGATISFSADLNENAYPARDFVVQHNESDLNFLMRQCENYGVSFYFDTQSNDEKIIFGDNNLYPEVKTQSGGNEIDYGHNRQIDSSRRPVILSFSQSSHVVPENFVVRDYNPLHPTIDLKKTGTIEHGQTGFSRMEYGANFTDTETDGKLLADVRAEEIAWQREVYRGICNVPGLRAGMVFKLVGHPNLDGSYIIVAAQHEVTLPAPKGMGVPGLESKRYTNSFECIRSDVHFRPARKTPKPNAAGLLTAKVDGAANDSIAQIDDQGRYKVRFHLDSANIEQEKASEYVRRAAEYAGPGNTGLHFPLLRNTEVVLACLNGDIDRPIIVGAVPNGATPNVVTKSNAVTNLFRTPSGSLLEFNDGTNAGSGAPSYAPFARLAAPLNANDVSSGSYFRLGAFISSQEAARMPSKASTAPLKYTKHTVSSTTNPAPEPSGSDWQDYVDAAVDAQDAGTDASGKDKGLVTADSEGRSEGSALPGDVEVASTAAEATTAEATVTEQAAHDWSDTAKSGYQLHANGKYCKLKKGYSKVSADSYSKPGYTKNPDGTFSKPGFNKNSDGTYVKQEYGAWEKKTVNGKTVYVKPGYQPYTSSGDTNYLKPGYVDNGEGKISKNKSSQIELNTISLVEEYNVAPDGPGILAITNKDFQLRVDGGAVVQIGKGHHLKVLEGDYQVAVDQGALFLGASSGVDIRGGSASKPANIALTAYGYIKQEAKGPVSEWSYSTKESRTYGYSKDWFYGEKYSEFHGKEDKIFYGSSTDTTFGSKTSTFLGAKNSVTLGNDFSFNLALKTDIFIGGKITLEVGGFLKATLAAAASIQLAAEAKMVMGAYFTYTMGTNTTVVTGIKTESIHGLSVKNVSGIDFKNVTGIDSKKVDIAIEFVELKIDKAAALNANSAAISAKLGQANIATHATFVQNSLLNIFP